MTTYRVKVSTANVQTNHAIYGDVDETFKSGLVTPTNEVQEFALQVGVEFGWAEVAETEEAVESSSEKRAPRRAAQGASA